jgi:rRNA maturation endonuclease Nob1
LVLGGCIVMGDDPEHHCNSCGHEWRTSPPKPLD